MFYYVQLLREERLISDLLVAFEVSQQDVEMISYARTAVIR